MTAWLERLRAPGCGSAFLGATVHVQAAGCGHSAVANVTIGQEVVQSVDVAAAIVNPGTAGACLVPGSITGPFPLAIIVPMNGQVAQFARITLTCGTSFTPTLPSPLPAACP